MSGSCPPSPTNPAPLTHDTAGLRTVWHLEKTTLQVVHENAGWSRSQLAQVYLLLMLRVLRWIGGRYYANNAKLCDKSHHTIAKSQFYLGTSDDLVVVVGAVVGEMAMGVRRGVTSLMAVLLSLSTFVVCQSALVNRLTDDLDGDDVIRQRHLMQLTRAGGGPSAITTDLDKRDTGTDDRQIHREARTRSRSTSFKTL